MSSGSRMACWFGMLVVVLSPACTASHDIAGPGLSDGDASVVDPEAGSGGRGGTTARAGAGGRAGAAGRGGAGGRGGSGGRAAAGSGGSSPARCGSCPAPSAIAGLVTATSCCTASGTCGLTAAALGVTDCQPLNGPGEADDSCPGAVIFGILPLEGCCTPDGTCGVLDDFLGLGCAKVATDGGPERCTP